MASSESSNLNLTEFPLVCTVATEKLKTFCSFCLTEEAGATNNDVHLLRCSKCKILKYCNSKCQTDDWKASHKKECKRFCQAKLAENENSIPDDWLRLLLRFYDFVASNKPLPSGEQSSTGKRRDLDDLMSHVDDISEAEFNEFVAKLEAFVKFDVNVANLEKEVVKLIYGKLKVNAFGIKNDELQSIGVGLYVNLCRLDHSCAPNARIMFKGRQAVVVGISEKDNFLKNCRSYEEIRHSYIDNLAPLHERRQKLLQEYYFLCKCDGCDGESRDRNEKMESLCCDRCAPSDASYVVWNADADGTQMLCKLCKAPFKDLALANTVVSLTKEMLNKLRYQKNVDKRLDLCAKTASMQINVLHDSLNVYKMRTLRYAYECSVKLQRWQDASVYGGQILDFYRKYLEFNDPYLVVFAKNLAVVYANAGRRDDALSLLNEFQRAVKRIFGEQSRFVKNIEFMMRKISK